jgi:DNA primase
MEGAFAFQREKAPSFFVNDQKMAWFDHSAGKNGNIFDFVMETEGLSFLEAVKRLARDAGLALLKNPVESREYRKNAPHLIFVCSIIKLAFGLEGKCENRECFSRSHFWMRFGPVFRFRKS